MAALPLADLVASAPYVPAPTLRFSWTEVFRVHGTALQIAIKAALTCVAAAAFYARFRFPFALLVIAGGAVVAVVLAVNSLLFDNASFSRLVMLLLAGLIVFIAAMRFDLADRLRATRRSDCAFWLHVLAAPLLMHSLAGLVKADVLRLESSTAIKIIVIAVPLMIIALIIDRRALLVSALVYLGGVIAFALSTTSTDELFISIATLVILGIVVLTLGVGWAPLRRLVLHLVPAGLVERLPPAVPA